MMHFLAMGGYAAYVWPSYGISLGSIALAVAFTWRAYARAKAMLQKIERDSGS